MLTLRENLLCRPWQERRYINHRHKVATALPVINNNPPPQRRHVSCKLKKFQREKERCAQIVSDNFTLLQHLSFITRNTRVDNAWDEPPPNFLNRVGIYKIRSNKEITDIDEVDDTQMSKTRKERCLGCNPHRYVRKETIPEERIPFPPPKKRISNKSEETMAKLPNKISPKANRNKEIITSKDEAEEQKRKAVKRRQTGRAVNTRKAIRKETQSLELSRGPVTLKIRFPFDSGLVYTDKGQDRVIQRERCECAAFRRRAASP